MKPKTSIILFLGFFLLVNTQYFWEQNLGMAAMIVMTISIGAFFVLGMIVVLQLFKLLRKENRRIPRIISVIIGGFVLLTTYIKPYGLIDFKQFEPETKLEANRTGGGNCNQKIKLFMDQTFTERSRCFSTSTTKGNWKLLNDTIYFSNVRKGATVDEYYSMAVIKQSNTSSSIESLHRFRDENDSTGHEIWIYKNELNE